MITATAPGKIILFGEHAVVYGHPALAIPVTQVGVTVTIESDLSILDSSNTPIPPRQNWRECISISAPDVGRDGTLATSNADPELDPIDTVIKKVIDLLGVTSLPVMHINISSSIPVASGLGSGAAVSVALIRALSTFLGNALTDEQVNRLTFETEKLYHGTPSGIDNTVITYAKPVYFVKDSEIETFTVGAPLTLVIGDSGVRAATHLAVTAVRNQWRADPHRTGEIFSSIAAIVEQALHAIRIGDIPSIGILMNQNHSLLQALKVSSLELDRLTLAALDHGALGAKLSGGGLGGNMIALVSPENAASVASGLIASGASQTIITRVI
jgi:mevalonate kinase